ncbi:transcription factor bHLH112-like [Salvia miltiorrhiza]|uniref:transcription factor bHLH112-like n=1 Tax=Salvia miltiorrhiza TaxID=226208 RepID=UPI0025AC1C7B|nr:transcription factor bHLH112-like [Salvia miltiorrhiza]
MEEEFQSVVCGGGNWWNSSRNLFASSPCSAAVNEFGWLNPSLVADAKTAKSVSDDSAGSASDGGGSVVLQEAPKPQVHPIDSTLHMMADDWNQDLIHDSARSQQNYSHMLQSMNPSMITPRQKIAEQWTAAGDFNADSSPGSFRQVYQNLVVPNSVATSQGLPATSFPLNTASYSYTSSLLHTFFDADSQPLLENEETNFSSSPPNFPAEVVPSLRPSFPKPQQLANNFQFINNTAFWNATAASSFLPSSTPQLIPSALTKPKLNQQSFGSKNLNGKAGEADSAAKKDGNEAAFKRPRIETPSPLPTFKVRKEKLGDRVTALQQLVSPFGKTDTASVLHEAIDYIKLLHDQVTVLSTPYLKNGPPHLQRQKAHDKTKDQEEPIKDLKSRGLCLVPISSTFPVATETTADFWTPTFGASLR